MSVIFQLENVVWALSLYSDLVFHYGFMEHWSIT